MNNPRYLTCAESAKLVRAALKAAFPEVTFRVKSKVYSGGASITIYWTDGPAEADVKRATCLYEGCDFDGMRDATIFKRAALLPTGEYVRVRDGEQVPDGAEEVTFGSDYIFTSRRFSREMLTRVAERTSRLYHIPAPAVEDAPADEESLLGANYANDWHRKVNGGNYSADELAAQIARTASRAGNVIVYPKG